MSKFITIEKAEKLTNTISFKAVRNNNNSGRNSSCTIPSYSCGGNPKSNGVKTRSSSAPPIIKNKFF